MPRVGHAVAVAGGSMFMYDLITQFDTIVVNKSGTSGRDKFTPFGWWIGRLRWLSDGLRWAQIALLVCMQRRWLPCVGYRVLFSLPAGLLGAVGLNLPLG